MGFGSNISGRPTSSLSVRWGLGTRDRASPHLRSSTDTRSTSSLNPTSPRAAPTAWGLLVVLAVAGCADRDHATSGTSLVSRATSTYRCAATVPNGYAPPGETRSPTDFGNGRLWTQIPVDGRLVVTMTRPPPPGMVFGELRRDGSISTKFPWWGTRHAGGDLRIAGTRLDGAATPLRASVAPGLARAPHFWASTITFTSQGCWQVTGSARRATLTFVVHVTRG